MGLFGAMSSGVSGLSAQSTAISVNADNISNLNTVGYKGGNAVFSTLVTDSSSTMYTSGGVNSKARLLIDQQGLVQSTGIVTDLAVSGKGFFVVNEKPDASGDFLYTRAGSFRRDNRGNFVNSGGFTLMGWPLDGENRLPGEIGNINTTSSALLDSLVPVNIKSVGGVAAATTTVSIGANLDASQEIFRGAGDVISFPSTSENYNIGADDIIVPAPASGTGIADGDQFSVTVGAGTYTFTYGGFVNSKLVTNPILGASTSMQTFANAVPNESFTIQTTAAGLNTFTYVPTSPNTLIGQFNNLTTLAAAIDNVSGLTARVVNDRLYVAPEDGTEALDFENVGSIGTSLAPSVASPILGATSNATAFTGGTTGDGLVVTMIDTVTGVETDYGFYYNPAPVLANEFDDLDELATAINATIGAGTAAVVAGALVITAPAGSTLVNTRNDNAGGGTSNFASSLGLQGTNFVDALQLADTTAAANRFATLEGLANLVKPLTGIDAIIENPISGTNLTIYSEDPLGEISFAENAGNAGQLLVEFMMPDDPTTYVNGNVIGPFGPAYDPNGVEAGNMASGTVLPHFSRNVRVFDALGTGHDFQMSYLKLANNTWGVEIFSLDVDEISTTRTDGLVASGTVVFNGDGSLRSVSASLTNPISITWTNDAQPSEISFSFGTAGQIAGTNGATTIGLTDGLRQFDADFNVEFIEQNGVEAGLLTSVNVDTEGYFIANFSNGESRKIFKLPLGDFTNPNGLAARAGNVYSQTQLSGNYNLREATKGGVGSIISASLESSNIELADELTRMIIAQRSYQANSKVISTVSDLLEELNQIFR